jgi:hypothetical protein
MTANKSFLLVVTLLALTAALAACGPSATEGVGARVTKTLEYTTTSTQYNPWPSWTPRFTRTPTFTITPTANSTIIAAFKSINATEEAWSHQTVPATQTARAVMLTSFPNQCGSSSGQLLLSPDANWLAQSCGGESSDLVVTNQDGSKVIIIPYNDIFSDSPLDPEITGYITPLYWSQDSQALYFTRDYSLDAVVMDSRGALFKMDISTKLWTKLTNSLFNHYSFSPDGRSLLYVNEGNNPLELSRSSYIFRDVEA